MIEPANMQMVILAGGLATRMAGLCHDCPKSMLPVLGKPFLQHQLELVRQTGIKRFVLCIGHLGGAIRDYFGDGSRFGVELHYSDEGESRLGTGGALKKAEPLLDEAFCMMWGDSYLRLDYVDIVDTFQRRDSHALLVVYKNKNLGDRSNIALHGNKVALYDKWNPSPELEYIDNGLGVMRRSVLEQLPDDEPSAIEQVYADLAKHGLLDAYPTPVRFYEIGSITGYHELVAFLNKESGDAT